MVTLATSRALRRLATLITVLGSALMADSLAAQEVAGTLWREGEEQLPAAGVLVVAERVSDGALVARAVSGLQGTFRLRLTPDRVVVRAPRVGQVPVVLDTIALARSETRELSRVLPEEPVTVAAARIVADARCRVLPDAAQRVARWFTDARTALIASQVEPPDGAVQSRVRVITSEGPAITHRDEGVVPSLRAFRSAPFDSIERTGFVVFQRDGTTRYRAPDADLLVDARFLARYCLHDVPTPDSLRGWVGIGFRPIERRRNLAEVEGTLWLDSASASLRRLTFRYVGTDPLVEQAGAGGQMEYERLESGVWFVQRWQLRTPRVGEATVLRRRDMRGGVLREVTGVPEVHGEVLEVRIAESLRFTTGESVHVVGDGAAVQALRALHARQCGASAGGGLVGHVAAVVGSDAAHVVALPAADVAFHVGERTLATVRTDAAGRFAVCDLPRGGTVIERARVDGDNPPSVLVRVPADGALARVDLVLPPR
jgi:hypothetical protein